MKNKIYQKYEYLSRYSVIPFFYDTLCKKQVCGIGSQLEKNTSFLSHKVDVEDTLDYLALKYYNNPTYWWIIAYFNDIQDALEPLQRRFSIIKIPNISSIQFHAERD